MNVIMKAYSFAHTGYDCAYRRVRRPTLRAWSTLGCIYGFTRASWL